MNTARQILVSDRDSNATIIYIIATTCTSSIERICCAYSNKTSLYTNEHGARLVEYLNKFEVYVALSPADFRVKFESPDIVEISKQLVMVIIQVRR